MGGTPEPCPGTPEGGVTGTPWPVPRKPEPSTLGRYPGGQEGLPGTQEGSRQQELLTVKAGVSTEPFCLANRLVRICLGTGMTDGVARGDLQ